MSEAKTVAIIGAGPVGLAAAAHVLERGLAADRAGSRRQCRPRHAAMGPRPAVLALGIQHRQGGGAAAGDDGLEFARARPVSDRRGNGGALSRTARGPRRAQAAHPHLEPRHRHQPRRLRQAQDQGPRKPRRSKSGIRTAKVRRSSRPMRSSTHPAPGIRRIRRAPTAFPPSARTEAADRIAYGMPDVLGKDRARYAGKTVAVLGAGHSAIGTLTDLAKLARKRRRPGRSGCCAAAIPPRPSAAAPMTSWSPAANLVQPSPRW